MTGVATVIDLLARPVYGMGEVDVALALPPGTARRWIDGYVRARRWYPPVVRVETTGDDVVTWGEFVETRLLAEYRRAGVPMIHLRPTVERLREELKVLYPLAYARTWLEPYGNELVQRVQDEMDTDQRLRLVVYRNDQLVLSPGTQRFVDSSVFEDVVTRLRPAQDLSVYIDPVRQFGRPVVGNVPTDIVWEQFDAGDAPEMIAELYSLTIEQILDAIRYENRREKARSAA